MSTSTMNDEYFHHEQTHKWNNYVGGKITNFAHGNKTRECCNKLEDKITL